MQYYLLMPRPSEEMLEDHAGQGITNVLLCSINSSPPLFSIFSLWNMFVFVFLTASFGTVPADVSYHSAMSYVAQESAKGHHSSSQNHGSWECS